MKVAVLSGGVGGGRFVRGLVEAVDPGDVTVIGNVGDDLEILSLRVCPDIDSVLYALADIDDRERGWGRADETWNALSSVAELEGASWFSLGDRDLGLHLVRTEALRRRLPLSTVTAQLVDALGLRTRLLPATDDDLRTWVVTASGTVPFQTWFVANRHRDEALALEYRGASTARPAPGVLEALEEADILLIAPSNPYTSIHPILAIEDLRATVAGRAVPCIAVSPVIGGRAVKGPVDKMLTRLAGGVSPRHVASCYAGLIDALVVDRKDAGGDTGPVPEVVTDTLMADHAAARRLARVALDAAEAAGRGALGGSRAP